MWVARATSSADSMSRTWISDTVVFARRRTLMNSLLSARVCRYTPSNYYLKARGRRSEKKIPKSVGVRSQYCFTPVLTRKESEQDPSYITVPVISLWKKTTKLRSLGGQPIFSRSWKRPCLLTRSNSLIRSMKAR